MRQRLPLSEWSTNHWSTVKSNANALAPEFVLQILNEAQAAFAQLVEAQRSVDLLVEHGRAATNREQELIAALKGLMIESRRKAGLHTIACDEADYSFGGPLCLVSCIAARDALRAAGALEEES